jgi:hypothetical protein
MASAARSRHNIRRIAGWGAQSEEEARDYLQKRLAVFSKTLFFAFVALVIFLFAMYAAYPTIEPRNQTIVYGTATLALAILAFLWRGPLTRGERSIDNLYRIDLLITIGSGCTFGVVAPLAYELEAAAYTCLLYESFVVFTRALLVPSSARRTLIVSSLAFVPIIAGSVVLAVLDARGIADLEIPGPAFVAGDLVYNAVAVILATTGSRIIYTLKQQVSEAKQLGQYTLGRLLGEGGMGAVYHAEHALLRRETAIKLVLPDKVGPENLDRFEKEVKRMSQLTHPNTVAVFDYGRSLGGELYYAMEYLEGVDLHRLVQLDGPQPPGRVIQILLQACGALAEAHDKGLIHRDIKPANIFLCEKRGGIPDVAKVIDFGLVQEIHDIAASRHLHGTPGYMAPEIVTDPSLINAAVDLYAIGAVGYYLLTGQQVFAGATPMEVVNQHLNKTPRPVGGLAKHAVPPALEAVIMKCLSKKPSERYPSATAIADVLAKIEVADWDRAKAGQWWVDYKARKAKAPTHDAPTVTLAVNVDGRLPSG